MSIPRFVLCTHNQGKLKEMRAILAGHEALREIEVLSPADFDDFPDPDEDGDSFLANAQLKARASFAHTGLPSLADDSGLVVPALSGAPGIYSARYAGVEGPDRDPANRRELLEAIADFDEADRAAHFHCTMVFKLDADREFDFTGTCEGLLLHEERGDGGFGYDPMFLLPDRGLTFAQIEAHEKNAISHRGRALQLFLDWLSQQ